MNFIKKLDFLVVLPVLGLAGISLSIVASTTPTLFVQQLIFIFIGFLLFILFASIDFRIWSKFIFPFYILSILLLIIVFFGTAVRGSTRWIDLGWFRLQPSELIKPFFLIILATAFSGGYENSVNIIYKPLLFFLPIAFFIFKQPDLGNVLVYLFVFMVITFTSGVPLKFIFTCLGILTIFIPGVWFILKEYQKARLLSFLDPTADPIGAGYNALQSVIAVGSGKLFGLGLGRGTQSHLRFLPEYHTDFVFASLSEELGFIGAGLVIVFYFVLLGRLLLIASGQKNRFARLLAIGVFAQIFIQVFINIGMNLGILPITGITLPLLSYGGSSVISTFISLGLVISIVSVGKREGPIVIK